MTTEEKDVKAAYMREWYKKNPERAKAYVKTAYQSARTELLEKLGGKCKKCGFLDARALQFDHINGGGNKERTGSQPNGRGGYGAKLLKEWLADPKIEEKLQVLCANCNWIKKAENKEVSKGNRVGNRFGCKGKPKEYIKLRRTDVYFDCSCS